MSYDVKKLCQELHTVNVSAYRLQAMEAALSFLANGLQAAFPMLEPIITSYRDQMERTSVTVPFIGTFDHIMGGRGNRAVAIRNMAAVEQWKIEEGGGVGETALMQQVLDCMIFPFAYSDVKALNVLRADITNLLTTVILRPIAMERDEFKRFRFHVGETSHGDNFADLASGIYVYGDVTYLLLKTDVHREQSLIDTTPAKVATLYKMTGKVTQKIERLATVYYHPFEDLSIVASDYYMDDDTVGGLLLDLTNVLAIAKARNPTADDLFAINWASMDTERMLNELLYELREATAGIHLNHYVSNTNRIVRSPDMRSPELALTEVTNDDGINIASPRMMIVDDACTRVFCTADIISGATLRVTMKLGEPIDYRITMTDKETGVTFTPSTAFSRNVYRHLMNEAGRGAMSILAHLERMNNPIPSASS